MKLSRIILLLTLGLAELQLSTRSFAQPAVNAAPDQNWEEAEAARPKPKVARPGRSIPMVEHYKWAYNYLLKDLLTDAMDYYTRHPGNPTRWMAVMRMQNVYASWDQSLAKESPEVIAEVNKVMSAEERAAWTQKIAGLVAALHAAGDVPGSVRLYFDSRKVTQLMMSAAQAKLPPGAPEWNAVRAELDALAVRHPREGDLNNIVRTYLRLRYPAEGDAGLKKTELRALAGSANENVASAARQTLEREERFAKPLELVFTAVDGRPVDLSALRGKVVLIDFWATWCGPCKEELPNVVANYKKYHDRGFEVVGITLEDARLQSKDTPEQTAAKLEKAKKILTDFTAKNDMPWPQYFDGKGWKNDISRQYAVESIPAMFLLDQSGKVVATEARGPKLEAELKRLLKL